MNSRWNYLLAAFILLIVWQAGAWWAGDAILAGPVTVAAKLVSEAQTGRFWLHVGSSTLRVLAALALSFLTAVPLGLFLGSSPRADRLAKPLIYLTYPVPKIVFLLVVLLVFGPELGQDRHALNDPLFSALDQHMRCRARVKGPWLSLHSLGGTKRGLRSRDLAMLTVGPHSPAHRHRHGGRSALLRRIHRNAARHGLSTSWTRGRADVPLIFVGIVVLAMLACCSTKPSISSSGSSADGTNCDPGPAPLMTHLMGELSFRIGPDEKRTTRRFHEAAHGKRPFMPMRACRGHRLVRHVISRTRFRGE